LAGPFYNGGGGSRPLGILRREVENTLLTGKITENFRAFGWTKCEVGRKVALWQGFGREN
jgi:hypothetical protein